MQLLTKGAILAGACSLLFGASIALSSVTPATAGSVHPDKKTKYTPVCASTSPCTLGDNSVGDGVEGYASAGVGVISYNDTSSYYDIYGYSYNTSGYPLAAYNGSGLGMEVDSSGDGYFTGTLNATAFNVDLRTRGGGTVGGFGATSTRPVLEDTGTGRLENGMAAVRFDSQLSGAIEASRGYQVFLTPGGETRGLYVAQKFQGGFMVREVEHGRGNLYFDYRIVAHPAGAQMVRLPAVAPHRAPGADGRVVR